MNESLSINIQTETLQVTGALLEGYNVPGSRYTSYPTAPEWVDSFGAEDFERGCTEENAQRPSPPLSVFIHLPFCRSLCHFCGCNVVISRNHEAVGPYLQNLKQEIDRISRNLDPSRPMVQLHWGGGTPTYLSPAQMEDLWHYIRERSRFASEAELGVLLLNFGGPQTLADVRPFLFNLFFGSRNHPDQERRSAPDDRMADRNRAPAQIILQAAMKRN